MALPSECVVTVVVTGGSTGALADDLTRRAGDALIHLQTNTRSTVTMATWKHKDKKLN